MNNVDISTPASEDAVNNLCLRVLFVSHTYVVGVNQGKLDAIAATGKADVGLLAPAKWKALEWSRTIEIENPYPRIKLHPARILFGGRVGAYFYFPWAIMHALSNLRPDVLQVEQEVFSLSAFEMAIWARLTGKPMVVFVWENMERHLSIFRQWISQFVMRTAPLIIAGNHDGAEVLRRWGYTGAIEVMPQMGVDTGLFFPKNKHRNDPFVIGFMGRLVYQKGIDILLAAARQLDKQGHNFRIILCGTGPEEATLQQEAQKQQVAHLLLWRGAVRHEEVPEEMGKFDVLVLPSRSVLDWKEQFGHVLIEAMAMGIPAIGSTCGEIPNVIGRSDLVFPEGDAARLATILERMICEPEWRQEVEQYCLNRVYQHYTHERIAQRLLNLWHKVLEHKSAKSSQLISRG